MCAISPGAAALVRRLNLLLAAGQISTQTEQRLVEILELGQPGVTNASDDTARRYRAIAAITLVMSCPEYLVQK